MRRPPPHAAGTQEDRIAFLSLTSAPRVTTCSAHGSQFSGSFAMLFFAKKHASSSFVRTRLISRPGGHVVVSRARHASNACAMSRAFVIPSSFNLCTSNSLYMVSPSDGLAVARKRARMPLRRLARPVTYTRTFIFIMSVRIYGAIKQPRHKTTFSCLGLL